MKRIFQIVTCETRVRRLTFVEGVIENVRQIERQSTAIQFVDLTNDIFFVLFSSDIQSAVLKTTLGL